MDPPAFDAGVGVAGERIDPDGLDNEHNSPMHDTIPKGESIDNTFFRLEDLENTILRGLERVSRQLLLQLSDILLEILEECLDGLLPGLALSGVFGGFY